METDYYQVLGVNLQPDHYQVLGVQTTEDGPAIRAALRRKAMENHPDRGGSVAAMQRINFAWEILSNPEKRSRYDALRANPNDLGAMRAANADAQGAAQKAWNYPRTWSEYETWLKSLAADFKDGHNGHEDILQTIEKSRSGWIFILGTALVASWFIGKPIATGLSELSIIQGIQSVLPRSIRASIPFAIVCPFTLFGGAWIGWVIHKAIANTLRRSDPTNPDSVIHKSQASIVMCNKCHQKLRVPKSTDELIITCTKCQNRFNCLPE